MTTEEKTFLTTVRGLLRERGEGGIYLCIRDLVGTGPALDRFSPGEALPLRQDITQYLAAWSRHVGLSEEECRGWLMDYCTAVLSAISKSSLSAIRHSTKSNIKYIYRSEVPFLCECANNRFRALCSSGCPVRAEMETKHAARLEAARNPPLVPRREMTVPEPYVPLKKRYLEQFERALDLVREEVSKGTKPGKILERLEQGEFKTRTGRDWTRPILSSELAELKARRAEPSAG